MPHAELKYSSDLTIDAQAILQGIERILQQHDAGSGDCKGRAYPASTFHHSHMIVEISMLPKPHRDDAFMAALREDLMDFLREAAPRPVWLSLDLRLSGAHYATEALA